MGPHGCPRPSTLRGCNVSTVMSSVPQVTSTVGCLGHVQVQPVQVPVQGLYRLYRPVSSLYTGLELWDSLQCDSHLRMAVPRLPGSSVRLRDVLANGAVGIAYAADMECSVCEARPCGHPPTPVCVKVRHSSCTCLCALHFRPVILPDADVVRRARAVVLLS
jgi:hypothetical protein